MGGGCSSSRTARYWDSGSRWVQRNSVKPIIAADINAVEAYRQKNLDLHL
jgi:hypothetical protein